MGNDLTLFPTGLARSTDPDTSRAAAESITGRTEHAILRAFDALGQAYPSLGDHGLTDDELCEWLPTIFPPTLKSARSRLSGKGFLVACGTRLSQRGRDMTVWKRKEGADSSRL